MSSLALSTLPAIQKNPSTLVLGLLMQIILLGTLLGGTANKPVFCNWVVNKFK